MADRLHVATRKGLFELVRGNGLWEVADLQFLGDPVSAVLAAADGTVYAALDLGHFGAKLWRRDPAGVWQELAPPAFPPKPPDADDDPHPWSLGKIWVLEGGGVAGRLWAGTMPGGLFRSDDGGQSWSLNEALWASTDGGISWRNINRGMYAEYMPPELREEPIAQDVHRLARCAAYPEIVWCQHHNGVFRSEDAGATWQELTAIRPSKFGFAVAAHPHDPNTAWFVPAVKDERRIPVDGKVVVARTRDGGRSFEVLRKGLPQHHAYDLVWRHALAVDASGERLAFGSTSGGLWVSEDGGDSWTMPEARLPPIAAVRFAPA